MIHRNLRALCERLLILPALVLCIGSPGAFAAAVGGGTYYVSGAGDDAAGDGSEANPWRTISHAVEQAGGGAPTIMVGAGNYSPDYGELLPIFIDQHDVAGISIQGPGDGSAVLYKDATPLLGGSWSVFEAASYITGEVVVDGLDVVGSSGGILLDMWNGAADVTINDVNAAGIGLLSVYAPYGGDYMVSNNEVVGASSSGVYVGFSATTSSSTVTGSLSVIDNHFVDVGYAVYYTAEASSDEWLDVNVSVVGNDFDSCSSALYMFSSATGEALFNVNMVIDDNTITDCGYPIYFQFEASYTAVINRNIEITNNSIVGSSTGIFFTSSVDEYLDYNETVLIDGNNIQGVYSGIYQSFEVSYESSNLDRDWSILNNTIEGCSGGGIFLYQEYTSTERGECIFDLTVDGNTIRDNGAGLYVEHYISYTADSSWNHVITRNHFYDNDDYAVFITVTASTADIDHDVVLRGNVFEGNEATSNESVVEVNIGYDLDGDYDLSFNMGTASAYGYNTIVADEANPLSGSISCDVYMSSITAGDVNMVGNWWGTQDLLEIGDRVWDQADSSSLFAADLSSPLPDSLDFTIAYDEGLGQITITAGPDAGFVAYAGDLNLMVEIVGFGTAEVPADAVSEDYQTITLAGGLPLPDGTYDICLTNPGGQTGCASFTVGGEEDCSGNSMPTAVSDSEGTDQATAVTIDLTANDVDIDGNLDPNSVVITQQPHRGTLVNNGDGTATYLPDADQVDTTDTFNYTVSDTCGATSNVASCEVVIGGSVNTIPSAIYDAVQTEMDAAITIDVLANDSDPDGDDLDVGSVVITGGANKGTATVNPDGTVTYTPNAGVAGTTDTFNYTVDDEHGATSNIATVEVFIQYIIDTEDVTGGIGGGADRSGTPGARGGLGNGANPNQGATRSP